MSQSAFATGPESARIRALFHKPRQDQVEGPLASLVGDTLGQGGECLTRYGSVTKESEAIGGGFEAPVLPIAKCLADDGPRQAQQSAQSFYGHAHLMQVFGAIFARALDSRQRPLNQLA